ncbi:hypothetical protein [Candidatus Parabeggiatoa sp. HSG14]|uniref:hypothetical protein n=1 Tax=Candidatus Parabeggiatoa sp. HSG14 TaxID=3055593 RepID=UPI0025A8F645|nr:hypothetical protein [Thiotrichales bacterium HSG14]
MSQFLWVEDFEEKKSVKPYTDFVFGELLQDVKSEQRPTNKEEMRLFLEKKGVFLELTFTDGLEFIYDPENLLKVDYIILDVRLVIEESADEDNEHLPNILKYYEKEDDPRAALKIVAGYQLYVELVINLGFPKEHILLCSNHANHLQSLADAFDKAKMRLPKIPTKEETDKAYVRNWVKQCRENPYSVLRRGILNMLDDIETNNLNLTEPFEKDESVNKDTFLEGLRFMLSSHRIPPNKTRQHLYKTLCDYLTKYFDIFSPKDHLYKEKYKGSSIQKEYFIPAYFVRNWVAHNILNNIKSKFSEQDVGFLFILVMKAMFNYSESSDKFKLLYDYPFVENTELQDCLVSLHNNCRRHLIVPQYETEIFELIRLRGEKKKNPQQISTEDFVALMYVSFLFSCVRIEPEIQTADEGLKYEINWNYLIDYQGDGLFEFLKSIAYHRLKERNF